MSREKTDVLVIGAGPSGTVAASIVHQNGLKVQVVEKQKFPRFVIGESLLPRSMEHFEEAGFLDALSSQGFEKKFGAKFLRDGQECLFDFSKQYYDGWTWTWQIPRADFDKVMADEVEKMGVPIHYETGVVDVKFNGSDSITTVEDNAGNKREIEAKFIIDSSGYGRVLPRLLNLDETSDLSAKHSIFTHCKDTNRPEGIKGSQITFVVHRQDVWIWVIPFSNGITSLGVVGEPYFFEDFSGTPEERLRKIIEEDPHFNERFRDVEYLIEPREIKGYSIGTKKLYGDGFALTGNSAEFLDPVFSSGVCFATESGLTAAKLASQQIKGEAVDWEKQYAKYIMHGINVFRSYVKAWYDGSLQDIFFARNENPKLKRQICSVLAGYVWDETNPFVVKHERAIKALSDVIKIEEGISLSN
ncbi:MAG: pyridine nucleotide-disulfide oxidoreductase [Flavobacteriales bacterium]|nr:MAG: pyridine nucleotide-disulfide oxidoreductase [Flavobacteriales bacterium]